MTLISIDEETCTKCGLCAVPCQLIYHKEGKYPRQLPHTDEYCMRCGHCVGLCPTGALRHAEMPPEETPPIDPSLAVSFEQCTQLVKSRRSIREYRDESVPSAEIERIIEAARYAPTGHNFQEVDWVVINDRNKVRQIASIGADWLKYIAGENPEMAELFKGAIEESNRGRDMFLQGAPAVILVCAGKGNKIAATDCVIALSYFDLLANTAGMGCCWAGFMMMAAATFPPMMEALDLPKDMAPYGAMMVGYPQYRYTRIPARKPAAITYLR
jgi:nitroreductase/Pyruvate/2-oxoacid:ferredoxin oxidoreductase delta subunit